PGIPEARRVAERVAERLADRPALGLQLLAGVLQLVPGVGEGVVADLVQPRFAVGDEAAADRPGQADPLVADRRGDLADVVKAALLLADLLGQLADVGEAGGVKLRPVVERHDDVRAGPDWIAEVTRAWMSLPL